MPVKKTDGKKRQPTKTAASKSKKKKDKK